MQHILTFLKDPEVVFPTPEVLANAAPGVLDVDAAPVPLGVLDVLRDPPCGNVIGSQMGNQYFFFGRGKNRGPGQRMRAWHE